MGMRLGISRGRKGVVTAIDRALTIAPSKWEPFIRTRVRRSTRRSGAINSRRRSPTVCTLGIADIADNAAA